MNLPELTTPLFRPVGKGEFELVRNSGFRELPPRLPEQPFFYPVVNEEYATQIAKSWNTRDPGSGNVGYVLRFSVRNSFLGNYPIRQVGDVQHREYWIPAADLPTLNQNIVGFIEILAEFRAEPDL